MTVSSGVSQYSTEAMRVQRQIGVTTLAIAVNADPVVTGLSMQIFQRILELYQEKLPTPHAQIARYAITGASFCASYSLASLLDPRLQVVCFLALLILDVKKMGPQNVWQVFTMRETNAGNSAVQTPSQFAAECMRLQIGFSLAAAITMLKIVNLNPLAFGIAANYLVLNEVPAIRALPITAQIILTGGMACCAYILVSKLTLKLQAISYIALLVFDVEMIGPKNAWRELTS